MATNGAANGQSATNGHTTHNIQPKITLYTNRQTDHARQDMSCIVNRCDQTTAHLRSELTSPSMS
jgi:hypothetical protein